MEQGAKTTEQRVKEQRQGVKEQRQWNKEARQKCIQQMWQTKHIGLLSIILALGSMVKDETYQSIVHHPCS